MGPVVKVLQGSVQGAEGRDLEGVSYYKFLGIPYAKPPLGELRFKDPQPPDSWIGVRDATRDGDACYHKDIFVQQYTGSEDCLYLNIFTRNLPTNNEYNLKPVMVWIHGGGFVEGSNTSKTYSPDFLLREDVVVVTINYRLGLLGFLRLKDTSFNISGNMGFKDQVEALRWIKSNIQQFNGDPGNVTLFGVSAGGASVHCHVLSPLSRDLFHRAIAQSGSVLNPWADECDHNAVQIAKIHDPSISTEKEALNILKNLNVEQLYELQTAFLSNNENTFPIGLVIEPTSKRNAFMTKRPIDIITSGDYNKVPIIFGYNENEGLMFNELRKAKGITKKVMPGDFIPPKVRLRKNDVVTESFIEKLRNQYLTGSDENQNVSRLISDAWFLTGIIGSVKNHAQTSALPVYLYKFSLNTQLNLSRAIFHSAGIKGCTHVDEVGYLFKSYLTPEIVPGSIEDVNCRRMVRIWTNFAKFGNPTPEEKEFGLYWKPAMPRNLNTLHIGEQLQMEVNPEGKRMDLWKQIYHQCPATLKYL